MSKNQVVETLNNHVTVRDFSPESISDEILESILNASRRSPSSSNLQAYSIIVVKNPASKKKLAALSGNQKHVETCPVFLAFCADISRLELAGKINDKKLAKGLELSLVATIDAALVGMSANTAAESYGLGVVMIGGIRNDPKTVAELLNLPKGSYVVYGMCLGYPKDGKLPPQKPRMAQELIIHNEVYNATNAEDLIREYDRELAAHYRKVGINQAERAWSGPVSQKLSSKRRPDLKKNLEDLGFVLD